MSVRTVSGMRLHPSHKRAVSHGEMPRSCGKKGGEQPSRRTPLIRQPRRRRRGAGNDEGSGTIAGIALIMVIAVLLSAIAAAGNLLMVQSQTRTAADMAAISSAQSLFDGVVDPCITAREVAQANAVQMRSCHIDGENMLIEVGRASPLPFAPMVVRSSIAGPTSCE